MDGLFPATPVPKVVVDRYRKRIKEEDINRGQANYAKAAAAGAIAGLVARFKKTSAAHRAAVGAGAGILAEGLVRSAGRATKDPYGERSHTAKTSESLPAALGITLAGGLAYKRVKKALRDFESGKQERRKVIEFVSDNTRRYRSPKPLAKGPWKEINPASFSKAMEEASALGLKGKDWLKHLKKNVKFLQSARAVTHFSIPASLRRKLVTALALSGGITAADVATRTTFTEDDRKKAALKGLKEGALYGGVLAGTEPLLSSGLRKIARKFQRREPRITRIDTDKKISEFRALAPRRSAIDDEDLARQRRKLALYAGGTLAGAGALALLARSGGRGVPAAASAVKPAGRGTYERLAAANKLRAERGYIHMKPMAPGQRKRFDKLPAQTQVDTGKVARLAGHPQLSAGERQKMRQWLGRIRSAHKFERRDFTRSPQSLNSSRSVVSFVASVRDQCSLERRLRNAVEFMYTEGGGMPMVSAAGDLPDRVKTHRKNKKRVPVKTISKLKEHGLERRLRNAVEFAGIVSINTAKKILRDVRRERPGLTVRRPEGFGLMSNYITPKTSKSTLKHASAILDLPKLKPHTVIIPRQSVETRDAIREAGEMFPALTKGHQVTQERMNRVNDALGMGLHEHGHTSMPAHVDRALGKTQRAALKSGGIDVTHPYYGTAIGEEYRANRDILERIKKHGSPTEVEAWRRRSQDQIKAGYRNPVFQAGLMTESTKKEMNKAMRSGRTPLSLSKRVIKKFPWTRRQELAQPASRKIIELMYSDTVAPLLDWVRRPVTGFMFAEDSDQPDWVQSRRKNQNRRDHLHTAAQVAGVAGGVATVAAAVHGVLARKKAVKSLKDYLKGVGLSRGQRSEVGGQIIEFRRREQLREGGKTEAEKGSGRFVDPIAVSAGLKPAYAIGAGGDRRFYGGAHGSDLAITHAQVLRSAYTHGGSIRKYAKRAGGLVRDAADVAVGNPRRADAYGRPQRREWEKPWFGRAVKDAAIGGTILAGALALKKSPKLRGKVLATGANIRRKVNQMVPDLLAGRKFKTELTEFNKIHSEDSVHSVPKFFAVPFKFGGKIDYRRQNALYDWAKQLRRAVRRKAGLPIRPPIAGSIPAKPSSVVRGFSGRLRATEFAKFVRPYVLKGAKMGARAVTHFDDIANWAGWDVRDPRGRSARVFAPGSRKRMRREKDWHERIDVQRRLLGALAVAGTIGAGTAGILIGRHHPIMPKKIIKSGIKFRPTAA